MKDQRKNCRSSQQPKKAFTLIELLVVIAIIALLLSILMPSLSKAKRVAQTVICRTRLKQMGLAFMLYANDNNDEFVTNDKPWGVTENYWFYRISKYIDNIDDGNKLGDFMRCPSGIAIKEYKGTSIFKWNSIDYNVQNLDAKTLKPDMVIPSGNSTPPLRITKLRQLGSWAAAFDFYHGEEAEGPNIPHHPGTVGEYFWNQIMDDTDAPPYPGSRAKVLRHDGVMNAVYLDGSVGKIKDPEWFRDMRQR